MTDVALSEPELGRQEQFFELLVKGVGPMNAAFSVGWSPAKLREKMRDREFREIVDICKERRLEACEERLFAMATDERHPSFNALQMILYSQGRHRGWQPPTQRVAMTSKTQVEITEVRQSVEAIKALYRELPVAEMQPGGAVEGLIESGDIEEAEVVEG